MNFYLLYRSTESYEMDSSGMINLLLDARKKNQHSGITGLLIYRDGHFMQLLEGADTEVRALYDRIAEDPRHTDARVLQSGYRDARLFPKWSMAYAAAPFLECGGHAMGGAKTDREAVEILSRLDPRHDVVPVMRGFLDLSA